MRRRGAGHGIGGNREVLQRERMIRGLTDCVHRLSMRIIVACGMFLLAGVLLAYFFQRLPIEGTSLGIDWRGLWLGIEGGRLCYGTGMRNPPWSILPLLPLGLLSFKESWAVLTLSTLAIEVLSVPQNGSKHRNWPLTIFLVTSYPSLRTLADGNLELLPIAGVLLICVALRRMNTGIMAAGLLMASAKPQETWLLIAVLGWLLLRTWPPRSVLKLSAALVAVVVPSLLLYAEPWFSALLAIEARGSILDVSLSATLMRLGLPSWVRSVLWVVLLAGTLRIAFARGFRLSREAAGLLISSSLLLAPYAAGNNLLTVIAIGLPPLFRAHVASALGLAVLADLPYLALAHRDLMVSYGASYSTAVLLAAWGIFAWRVQRRAPE